MKINQHLTLLFLLLFAFTFGYGQGYTLKKGVDKQIIKFKLVNNLIIVPIEVNGVELSFVLDTGVSRPILFNITDADSVDIRNAEEIYLKGLGGGDPIEAYRSEANYFRIKDAFNLNQDLYLVFDKDINFSPRIGFPVHGIIGYDFFKDFVVKINYSSKTITLYNPKKYKEKKCRKCKTLPIKLVRRKPYVEAKVTLGNGNEVPVNLLIDSGNTDALWLFSTTLDGFKEPTKFFEDYLGRGLSGNIHGKRARVTSFSWGNFTMKNAIVAYPDSLSLQYLTNVNYRNGSIGSEILKRFNLIVDYPNRKITLKKNSKFKDKFKYNISGIELQHNGMRFVKELESGFANRSREQGASGGVEIQLSSRFTISLYPAFEIAEVRKGSPAAEAGLRRGDIVVSVNNKGVHNYSLQELSGIINEKPGKRIKIVIERNGSELIFSFVLKEIL
jgi:hypothetical protein